MYTKLMYHLSALHIVLACRDEDMDHMATQRAKANKAPSTARHWAPTFDAVPSNARGVCPPLVDVAVIEEARG